MQKWRRCRFTILNNCLLDLQPYGSSLLPKILILYASRVKLPRQIKYNLIRPSILLAWLAMSASAAIANMASPIQRGSGNGFPFVSQHIQLQFERLLFRPDSGFNVCHIEATYAIFADTEGLKVPMLVLARDVDNGVFIDVDGMPVDLQPVPSAYFYQDHSPLTRFEDNTGQEMEVFELEWQDGLRSVYHREDLQYFEVDLSAGVHVVKISYDASAWHDRRGWISKLFFPFALSPAKDWPTFGPLDIAIDASAVQWAVKTNLGPPQKGNPKTLSEWHFETIPPMPTLYIENDIPESMAVSSTANWMMDFGMEGFLWSSGGLFALFHLLGMWAWRKRNRDKRFSWVWMLGSILVPFCAMIVYCLSYDWINSAIGPAASKFEGYYFLIFLFYVPAALVYGLLMAGIGYLLKRSYR
jgi:hypothetical protein